MNNPVYRRALTLFVVALLPLLIILFHSLSRKPVCTMNERLGVISGEKNSFASALSITAGNNEVPLKCMEKEDKKQ